MENLCKCNNCGKIMYDENPQTNSTKIDIKLISVIVYPMEMLNEEGDTFWGCGDCQTDSFLTDIKDITEI